MLICFCINIEKGEHVGVKIQACKKLINTLLIEPPTTLHNTYGKIFKRIVGLGIDSRNVERITSGRKPWPTNANF